MTTTTLEQRLTALEQANRVRTTQAAFARRVSRVSMREGCEMVANAIEAGTIESFPVGRLLRSIHAIGDHKMIQILTRAEVRTESRRVGQLTSRQKKRLAAVLRARAW